MALFKCKMCGGDLEIADGLTIAECEYCGTKQTVPKSMDENMQNLFNRANTLRIKSEFDKAEKLYEKIIQVDTTQSEAYWGMILCKYGIEYVDDPATFKKIPTCHRASYDPIIADDDYKSAIENADMSQRAIYEAQAKEIDRIQKEILALAQKEETYDVFICYKETDADGRRTQDSVIANDIYYQLKQEGFKVFYAAITLEGKLGSAYEPIIFAALNSAKVMLSIGTKPEYFNAVWVKNEWSRFLKIIRNDRSKLLIPCYRDMDAYELPEEFAHLQAQDMGKIGFINDIVRGIKKVIKKEEPKATAVIKETVISSTNISPLLKRVFMFLEDGDWNSANEYCEKVLDIDPENAEAYLGKLMSGLRVKKQEFLKDQAEPFDNNNNYQKAIRFANEKLKNTLTGYIEHINTRNENARLDGIYTRAKNAMSKANTESAYKEAAQLFESISKYKDSAVLAQSCYEKAEEEKRKAEEEKKKCDELYKEYKAAVKNENSATNKKAEVDKIISLLRVKHDNLIDLKNNWQGIENELLAYNNELKTITSEIVSLNNEKSNLGFFAGKRKKEIAAKITVLEGKQQSLRENIDLLQKKKQGHKTISEVENEISRIIQQIEEQKKILEELSSARSSKEIRDELSGFELGEKLLKRFDLIQGVEKDKYISFGAYEQDNDKSKGKEAIEWLVLEVKDGKALVISKYGLDCKRYNEEKENITWETCTLRKWLNSEFINTAFTSPERSMIPTVTVSADKNPKCSTNPGNATRDQVFLLSIAEAKKYFSSDRARRCKLTDYAVANKVYVNSENGNCWWWLRSPGHLQNTAARVLYGGVVYEGGLAVDDDYVAVRPALWIDLTS